MRVLSWSSVFPNVRDRGHGLFVQARLLRLARLVDLRVMAPVAGFDRTMSNLTIDSELDVTHPRWTYLPGTGVLTAAFLAKQMLEPVRAIRQEFPFEVLDVHFGYPDSIAGAWVATRLGVPFVVTLRGSELLHARYPLRRH